MNTKPQTTFEDRETLFAFLRDAITVGIEAGHPIASGGLGVIPEYVSGQNGRYVAHYSTEENILEDADAPYGLCAVAFGVLGANVTQEYVGRPLHPISDARLYDEIRRLSSTNPTDAFMEGLEMGWDCRVDDEPQDGEGLGYSGEELWGFETGHALAEIFLDDDNPADD